jgi:hypothetical protein
MLSCIFKSNEKIEKEKNIKIVKVVSPSDVDQKLKLYPLDARKEK